MSLAARLAAAALLVATTATAAPRATLDAYVLFATERLRIAHATVQQGDLGVDDGLLAAGPGLTAAQSQLAGGTLRLGRGVTCAARFGTAKGRATACPDSGTLNGPLVGAVAARCGMPDPFPACASDRTIKVTDGATHRLGGGTYGRLVVTKGTVELAGGHYVFCDVTVGRRGRIDAAAPVEVDVAGALRVAGTVQPSPDGVVSTHDVRVRVGGRAVRIGPKARVATSLCAPGASLTARRATIEGGLVARRIRVTGGTLAAPYAEERAACGAWNPLRNAYFGDLHIHTQFSFDVRIFGASTTIAQAYRFAQGESLLLAPNDDAGQPTRPVHLDRPLDFAAVTDHSEFLGEVEICSVPGSPGYDSSACVAYRGRGFDAFIALGASLYFGDRDVGTCSPNGSRCTGLAAEVWQRVQDAARHAWDRSAACGFTSLVGYEYTKVAPSVSTLHRNVIFRNDRVPMRPITYFEARDRATFWTALRDQCVRAGTGCDVLAIPHNTNESNGQAFLVEYPEGSTPEQERALAILGASMEPLVEIFQHKGDSECMNGLSGIVGAPDEQCDFEKRLLPPVDCGDGVGAFGAQTMGCLSRRDFVRGALLEGMSEATRIGVNPFRLGIIASTDTHNGTGGYVAEDRFGGHQGENDATPEIRLGTGTEEGEALINDPGGLAGVWAEENSRPAIFDALRRRETFGTSGPRIAVRLFGGYGLASGLCSDPDMVRTAYATGVPMGGVLGAPPAGGAAAPSFLVAALRDPGTAEHPGTPLERIQIVKGWLVGSERHVEVYDIAGTAGTGTVDEATCATGGTGADQLCAVWTDPAFDPSQHAYYYARVLENPSCRWSTWDCVRLPPDGRPLACSDPAVPRTIQERAWSSPVWFEPGA